MNIEEFLHHLEETKRKLLALNLPPTTRLVNPPDMGSMFDFGEVNLSFEPKEVFVKNGRCYLYKFLMQEELTETEKVVIVKESYPRR